MIRTALPSDIPALVALAGREHAASPWAGDGFDAEAVAATMATFMSTFGRTMLRSEGGYLAGVLQPSGFSARLLAIEFALYAEDGSGMALVEAFEGWAAKMGAAEVVLHDMRGGRLARVLAGRRGYEMLGMVLNKTIGGV